MRRTPITPVRWKQPAEVRTITFDFASKLITGDAVASVVGNALDVEPAGITASEPTFVANRVSALLSGGTIDSTYRVACRVLTTLGETLELDVDIEVLDGAN
jgi:hypothetical protein